MTEQEVLQFLQQRRDKLSRPEFSTIPKDLDFQTGFYKGVYVSDKYAYKFDMHDDTAESEYQNYLLAKQWGADRALLPVERICINRFGVAIYRQPKFTITDYHIEGPCFERWYDEREALLSKLCKAGIGEERIDEVFSRCYDDYRFPEARLWMRRAIQLYGMDAMLRFAQWTQDCEIEDLHLNNIGYIGNYRPVVIDYGSCGFQE